eukprot:TRINITY_DN11345_c0_g1_i2.p1 TRINITY_DN11345_c0_g1~~TRINITY_DN11345_c0_g1_i2.p1  ORF type:complete len:181 (-),score=20.48 TRINITY_DN11345_c0_g1_i2:318-860(-)
MSLSGVQRALAAAAIVIAAAVLQGCGTSTSVSSLTSGSSTSTSTTTTTTGPRQFWVGNPGATCNATCANVSMLCDFNTMAGVVDQGKAKIAFAEAGVGCDTVSQEGCTGTPLECIDYGPPYVHEDEVSGYWGSTTCQIQTATASCDLKPVDMGHQRLCACMSNSSTTTTTATTTTTNVTA